MSQSDRKPWQYFKEAPGGDDAVARLGTSPLRDTSPAYTASQSARAL
jgi:hypothetical protein